MSYTKINRIPFVLFSFDSMKNLGRRFSRLSKILLRVGKNTGQDLRGLDLSVEAEDYLVASFFSGLAYGLLFFSFAFLMILLTHNANLADKQLPISTLLGITFFMLFFFLHIVYPGIIRKKIAAHQSKDLLFALREMVMNIESGITLFDAMRIMSTGDYGYVSRDFEKVVRGISAGQYEKDALKQLAIESESEYVRRAVWQIVNSLETGSRIGSSLSSIVDTLEKQMYRDIRDYSSNLNFIMLIYMLIAAAVPSLGVTFIILLSAFSGAGVDITTVGGLLAVSGVVQLIIIGYVNTTRPDIFK